MFYNQNERVFVLFKSNRLYLLLDAHDTVTTAFLVRPKYRSRFLCNVDEGWLHMCLVGQRIRASDMKYNPEKPLLQNLW